MQQTHTPPPGTAAPGLGLCQWLSPAQKPARAAWLLLGVTLPTGHLCTSPPPTPAPLSSPTGKPSGYAELAWKRLWSAGRSLWLQLLSLGTPHSLLRALEEQVLLPGP